MVKKLIRKENLDLIGLTETKHHELIQRDISQSWGNHRVEWIHVAARQHSGGLLLMWRQEIFSLCNSFAMPRWLCIIGEILDVQTKCAFCLLYAPNNHYERMIV